MAGPWEDYGKSKIDSVGPWTDYGKPKAASADSSQNSSTLGDLGTDLKRGVQQIPGIATGLADATTGALTNRRFADDLADKAGELTGFQPETWAEEARQEYSPQRQAAEADINQAWEEGDALDVAGAYATNPAAVAGRVAEAAPQMLVGGLVGRGALVAGRATGVISAPATTAQAARQAATAGAIGEGAVTTGSTMNQIDESVEPQRAAAAALGAGAGTAVLGRVGAAVAQRAGLADVESAIAGGIQRTTDAPGLARRVAGGAVAEGLLEELPQSVQEQMWQNFAENKSLMEGTARAAVEGTIVGGAMGAGVNVLPQRKPSEEMGLDPSAGPLSAAAVTAVDGAPTGSQSPIRDAVQSSLLDGAPAAGRGTGIQERDLADLPTAVAQDMFYTEVDDQNGLRYFQYDQNLQTMVEVPAKEAMAAAQARIQESEQLGEDPLGTRSPEQLLPDVDGESGASQVEEVEALPAFEQGERVVWANKDFDQAVEFLGFETAPGADGRVYARVRVAGREGHVPAAELQAEPEQPLPLPTVEMDSGPQATEQVQAAPTAADPGYDYRVQKNGRPFKGENDVRLRKAFNDAVAAGEQPVVVQRDGGWAVAVPRPAVEPAAPLALPSPSTMVVDGQGNAQRGATAPFVEPGSQVRPLGGPGMERQVPRGSQGEQGSRELATIEADPQSEPPSARSESSKTAQPVADTQKAVASVDVAVPLPDILRMPRKRFIERQAKATGIKKGSPGYEQAVRRLQDAYEADLDRASAGLPFALYQGMNSDSPESLNRQAWEALRAEYGITEEAQTSEPDSATTSKMPTAVAAPAASKIEDFGEKIGGARKDRAEPIGQRPSRSSTADARPAWARRFEISQVVKSSNTNDVGRWEVRDNRAKDWMNQPKKVGTGSYATREEAEQAIPLIAVAQKHRVVSQRQGDGTGFEIWRDVTDRKRVKVVDQVFVTRTAAMEYMAANAQQILETNTTFGEADLPRPVSTQRSGAARRDGPVKDRDFTDTFGFRGVEFGNWNNQEERQQLLDDAYDGLLDLTEVMAIPPEAISLNGELALAFGARGHGLSGARAHYEPSKAVINLTKMNGAGSLAHEWFHALDHYFGRQDGKASAEWVTGKDGTRSLEASDSFERDAASGGFRRANSGVREAVRVAYAELMKTMTVKAEQYVADTARADDFVARSRKDVTERLDRLRADLAEQKDPKYWKRSNKPASAEQLAGFDTVAQQIIDGVQLDTELRVANPDAPVRRRGALSGMRWTNDALEQISAIYKAVRGRTGFNADNNGVLDNLRGTMGSYSARLKMLADAQDGTSKTRSVPTDFAMDAKELDQGRGTNYWTTPHEMAARAFQGYVEDMIAARGGQSPFLNYGPENVGISTPWGWKRPFPAGTERQAINRAFDNLVQVLETRQGEDGRVALYSRSSYRPEAPEPANQLAATLSAEIAKLIKSWRNAPRVEVVQSVKDLPSTQRRTVENDGAFDVEGMLSDGIVYLVADNLRDAQHAAFVMQHEVLGHAGLQGAYGHRLSPLLMSIYKGNPALKQKADQLVQRFGYQPAVAMEEVLADMAAAGSLQQQPIWPRLLAAMRAALRAVGLDMQWSADDVQRLLGNARRYIQNGVSGAPGKPGSLAFSRDGRSGRSVEVRNQAGHLVAPNGKQSRLTEKQWHQARTPTFKRWFGDWQALTVQERLDGLTPLRLKMPEGWRNLSDRAQLARIETSLKQLARDGELIQHAELGAVRVGMSGAKKAASSAADPAKRAVLDRLQQSFEQSIYASSVLDQQGPTPVTFHKLLAPIDIDGVPLVAVFTVREDANGRMFYNAVTVDRKAEAPTVSPGDVSNAQRSTPANARAPADFVRQPLQRVNPATVSKATDGNGEPLVLFHGTAEEFNIFEQGRAGHATGHASAPLGIFLTTDRATSEGYAVNASDGMPGLAKVMQLYASIKNPYELSIAESQKLETVDKSRAFRAELEKRGHDGIRIKGTSVWVAFGNNQVKSATNNTGAFDDIDPDVRYRRGGQGDVEEAAEVLRKLGLGPKGTAGLRERIAELTQGDLRAKLREWAGRSEEGIFDGLAGIKRAEESVGITSPDQQGYVSARMASGIADVMHGVLHYAAPEWRDGVVSGKAGTRGVLDILGDLGPSNLTPWLAWLGGKRGQLLKAQGRENNLTDADIAELLAMGQGKEELFERVYRDYAKVNEAVLDLAQEGGLIDQDARATWLTDYYVPFYRQDESESTFTAPRSKRGLSHQTAAIKALKGGKLPTNDLLSNMLAGWTKRIDASMKNKALLEVVENLKGSEYLADESPRWQQVLISRDQIAQQIRKDRKAQALAAQMLELPATANLLQVLNKLQKPESEGFEQLWTRVAPTEPDIIRVQRGGKSEYYRVNDESLLRGLKFIEGSVFNDPITRIGRAFKRLLTTGVTASPDFILRNFIRDAAHAWMINKDGFTLGKDSIKGMRDALREDQDYRDLMFAGGSFQGGYVHGADPEASAQIVRRALEKKGFTRQQQDTYVASLVNTPAKAASMLKQGWEMYRELGDKVENANRLSTYKAALNVGKSRRQAAFEAKDLMDYSMRGNFAAAQWFTDVVPFLNARLQGLYKLGRAVKGDKTLLAKEVAMKGAYIAMFSLLLAGLNDDDERYQALQDWDKDMHWHIFMGDQHFRIPKPFELGLVFGTVPERLLHALTGSQDGGDLAKAVSQGVFQTLAFNPVPQFYQPIRELQANRNFFRDSPIEDMSDEGKLSEARYDERTSAIGYGVGQVTGPLLGLSPKQVDHLVQGYTGTLGAYVLAMSSLIAGAFKDGDRPSARAADLPVAKVIYQGNAVTSSKYQSEFYDMMREADQLQRTLNSYREEGKVEAAAELYASSSEKLRHRPALGLARRQLGNIRSQMDAVYRDERMDGDMKRQRLDELQRRSNEIAKRIAERAGGDF